MRLVRLPVLRLLPVFRLRRAAALSAVAGGRRRRAAGVGGATWRLCADHNGAADGLGQRQLRRRLFGGGLRTRLPRTHGAGRATGE